MRRRLVRKFGSVIGLLAILMATLAPAVSQTLVSNARANAIFSAHCSAITEFQTSVADHPPAHPSIADHRDACGYCNFAAHSAAAPPSINTLPARIAAAAIPVNAAPQPIAPFAPSFAAQPRAPPFSA